MTAEVMKFAESKGRRRAWWRVASHINDGYDLDAQEMTASEALDQIGDYTPFLRPLPPLAIGGSEVRISVLYDRMQIYDAETGNLRASLQGSVPTDWIGKEFYTTIGGEYCTLDMNAIVRPPVPEDNTYLSFGIVTPQYNLVTPRVTANVWDTVVRRLDGSIAPVETIGALRRGSHFFICTKLTTLNVAGEDVESYMAVLSPMNGVDAVEVILSDTAVVCMNTWRRALDTARDRFTIGHHARVVDDMAAWMSHLHSSSLERTAAVKEAYDWMAQRGLKEIEFTWFANNVFNDPDQPSRENFPVDVNPENGEIAVSDGQDLDAPSTIFERAMRRWETVVKNNAKWREGLTALYEGEGVGASLVSRQGTAWGAFQAVTELTNYGGHWRGEEGRVNSILFGERATINERAFNLLLEIDHA